MYCNNGKYIQLAQNNNEEAMASESGTKAAYAYYKAYEEAVSNLALTKPVNSMLAEFIEDSIEATEGWECQVEGNA